MARSTALIQAEIDSLESEIAKAVKAQSYSIAGRSKSNQSHASLTARLDKLYQQLARANGSSPMIVRGHVEGLR